MNGPENLIDVAVNTAPLPKVRNHTAFPSQYFQMLDVSDQVFHVMVCRQTYDLRRVDSEGHLQLAEIQTPLATTDQFYGEINKSSVIQESDFAPYKPKCDVLFTYTYAHAPGGQPLTRWPVAVRIGSWEKRFTVTGSRMLKRSETGSWYLSEPTPTLQVPICYERAYGGTCQWPLTAKEPELLYREERNPLGYGYLNEQWLNKSQLNELPAPQLEVFEYPFTGQTDYPVIGLSALGRWWLPRRTKAGTYDDAWKKQRWPHLPLDFDFAYWNGAPEDQQIAYPQGGEEVVLLNLHQKSEVRFRLPKFPVKLLLHLDVGVPLFKPMSVDTLIFDMKNLQLIVVQRALVAASAGVDMMEVGTWDIEAARAKNTAILQERNGVNHGR